MNCYLGVDIGSISTKGVIIDECNNIIASAYIWTEGNPVKAVRNLIEILKKDLDSKYVVKGIGTTGSARKLIGLLLNANVVKNEIMAHAIGTLSLYPDVKTILEILSFLLLDFSEFISSGKSTDRLPGPIPPSSGLYRSSKKMTSVNPAEFRI